jgi:hypothetical protein
MKQIGLYSLLVIMLALTGCPAHTDHPVDEGSYDVPSWLPGKWSTSYGPSQHTETYRFENGRKKGRLKCSELDSVGNVKGVYDPVIMSKVGNKIFLSALSTEGYYLFEIVKKSDGVFDLKELDESIVDGSYDISATSSSAQLKAFLLKNKDDDGIYGSTSTYKKQ